MVRLLILIVVLLLLAYLVWTLLRIARARAGSASADEEAYRVTESVGDGNAIVEIERPLRGESVLVGSVALDAEDFDERYAQLILRAEDRAATLNAGRRLRSGS